MTEDNLVNVIGIARLLIALGMSVADGIRKLFGADKLTDQQIDAIEAAAQADDDRRIARRIAEMS